MDSLIGNGATYTGKCYCENGSSGSQENCPIEGYHFCKNCNEGFELKYNFCVKLECICSDKNGIKGFDCNESLDEKVKCPKACAYHSQCKNFERNGY